MAMGARSGVYDVGPYGGCSYACFFVGPVVLIRAATALLMGARPPSRFSGRETPCDAPASVGAPLTAAPQVAARPR